ncbi:MAG: UPF0149 family protein [Polyangiaceae bacterium]
MPKSSSSLSAFPPLSDDEFDELADLLGDHCPFDIDGLLGVLHAVAVAPGIIPPSAWIATVLPERLGALDSTSAQRWIGLTLRLHNEVVDAVNDRQTIVPAAGDVAGCESFAAGYIAGAALDPLWIGNEDRWSFASCFAYLAGRCDLVPEETLDKFEKLGDVKDTLRRQLGAVVAAARDSFLEVRRAPLSGVPAAAPTVARKAPCPCGSGKKYKRCCADRRDLATR